MPSICTPFLGTKQISKIAVRTVQPKLVKNEGTAGKVKNLDN
jgi:hypothetical protein